jgi:hypothetical protein
MSRPRLLAEFAICDEPRCVTTQRNSKPMRRDDATPEMVRRMHVRRDHWQSTPVFRIGVVLPVWAAPALMAAFAAPALDSREYKLALAPAKFAGPAPSDNVSALWENVVKPVIDGLDARSSGKSRLKKGFDDSKNRRVLFRDTKTCELAAAGFALRERVKVKDGKLADAAKLTPKSRAPDEFMPLAQILRAEMTRSSKRTSWPFAVPTVVPRYAACIRVGSIRMWTAARYRNPCGI